MRPGTRFSELTKTNDCYGQTPKDDDPHDYQTPFKRVTWSIDVVKSPAYIEDSRQGYLTSIKAHQKSAIIHYNTDSVE